MEENFSNTLWPTSASATSVSFFLKMIGGIGPKAIQTATQNVAVGMNVVRNGICAGHEPLEAILARTPMTEAYKHAKPSSRTGSWKHGRHPAFQAQQGLTDAEVAPGQSEFYEATHLLMLPREQEAIWFELCKQRKKRPHSYLEKHHIGVGLWFQPRVALHCSGHVPLRKARKQVSNFKAWCAEHRTRA